MSLLEEAELLVKETHAIVGVVDIDPAKSKYEEYLNMGENDLRALNREGCIVAQFILSQYAATVAKKYNTLKAHYQINQTLYFRELGKVYGKYDAFAGKDVIVASAANEFENIRIMQDENLKIHSLLLSLEGLVERVDKMIQVLKDLSFTKR